MIVETEKLITSIILQLNNDSDEDGKIDREGEMLVH